MAFSAIILFPLFQLPHHLVQGLNLSGSCTVTLCVRAGCGCTVSQATVLALEQQCACKQHSLTSDVLAFHITRECCYLSECSIDRLLHDAL